MAEEVGERMNTEAQKTTLSRVVRMSAARLLGAVAQLALILFSCTAAAGEASDYAFRFYRDLFGLEGSETWTRLLAEKGVHIVLFFSLGSWLYHGLRANRRYKLFWAMGLCFLVGVAAEALQTAFPIRHASGADVMVNAASGALAAALASRYGFSARF